MREIKVRGYAVEEMVGSQWTYGTGVHKTTFTDEYAKETGKKYEYFIWTESGWVEVYGESIGQYTGLKEGLKESKFEIYEGDIVKGHWWKNGTKHRHIGRVVYVMNAFMVRGVKQYLGMDDDLNPTYEVIGNIYENPELLEESQ